MYSHWWGVPRNWCSMEIEEYPKVYLYSRIVQAKLFIATS